MLNKSNGFERENQTPQERNEIFNFNGNSITFQLGNGDVMVNATEMAKGFGKFATEFLSNQQTKNFISVLEPKLGIPSLKIIRGGNTPGTWMHQKLALKFAAWLNPEFELWVYDRIEELLKFGVTATEKTLDDLLSNPDLLIGLASQLKIERAEKERLQAEVIRLEPKRIFAEAVSASKTTILIGELAKILNQNGVDIGQNKLFEWLRLNGFLISRKTDWNTPTQKSMDLGLFFIKESIIHQPDGHIKITKTTKVTGKGQEYFINKFLNKSAA